MLALVAGVLALIAVASKSEPSRRELQRWANKFLPDTTRAGILRAYDEADHREYVPRPREVGALIDLRAYEWVLLERPWGVHPVDLTETEVDHAQRERKRAVDRERKRLRDAQHGATPRSESIAAVARRLGLSRPTLRKRMKETGHTSATAYEAEFSSLVAPHIIRKI
jgi:hypothetical protein